MNPVQTPRKAPDAVYTDHARIRMQQRGIALHDVHLVRTYGEKTWAGHGAIKRYMTQKGRRRIQRELGMKVYKQVADRLNICVVEENEMVLTVEKRYRKVRRW